MSRRAKGINPLRSASVAGLLAASLISVSPLAAEGPVIRFAGELSGLVTDSAGKPQPGATVMLFNKQDRLLLRSTSDLGGTFSFDELVPDLYSVKVSFASFVPAARERVIVRPGMRSLLEVNLSRIFSSVQLVSMVPAPGGLMSDDWKWTLRSDAALRPILRFMPASSLGIPSILSAEANPDRAALFSGSHGMVKISASDGAQSAGMAGEADLGTQFAFATSVHGSNHVQVSGNVGYGAGSGSPAASFRTTYSRDMLGTSPALSVTMRQLFVPVRTGQTNTPATDSGPILRTLAISYADRIELSDVLSAEYGGELDMVSFLDRLHYLSPYARLNYAIGSGKIDLTWTSGNSRPELGIAEGDPNSDLRRDLAALSVVPLVTLENGRSRVQRGDDYELGMTQKFGSREFRIAAYNEHVSNTSLMIANPEAAAAFAGDLVPDLFSNSALFNAGAFDRTGYMASVTQNLGDDYRISATWGSSGVLEASPSGPIESADDLRNAIHAANRQAVTLRASGTVRHAGTRFVTSYQWADYSHAMPGPQYSTGSSRPEPGLNIVVRQPIPSLFGWRVEASAEVRNLLAQGYLPLTMAGGQQLLLVNTPRSFRGGLAFVF
jgi:hypothetical protein